MGAEALRAAYVEAMMEDPALPLGAFLERVAAGELGPHSPRDVEDFLRGVERDILASIQTRAEADPALGPEADARAEEARQEIALLIRRYAGGA